LPIKTKEPLKKSYSKISECPLDVQDLPDWTIQRIWIIQYNNAVVEKSTYEKAKDIAWEAVKKFVYYDTNTCQWKRKQKRNTFAIELQKALKRKLLKNNMVLSKSQGEGKMSEETLNFHKKFECFVPLKENGDGLILYKVKRENEEGEDWFIEGEASNNKIDKENDRVSKSFLKKMAKNSTGLTIYAEHEHDLEHALGVIVKSDYADGSFSIKAKLEPEENNDLVKKIVSKIQTGINLGFSVFGALTKVAFTQAKNSGAEIRELLDGMIDEISVTSRPAGNVASIGLSQSVSKSFNDMIEDIKKSNKEQEDTKEYEEDIKEKIEKEIDVEDLTTKQFISEISKKLGSIKEDASYDLFMSALSATFWSFRKLFRNIMRDEKIGVADKKKKINILKNEYVSLFQSQIKILFSNLLKPGQSTIDVSNVIFGMSKKDKKDDTFEEEK